MLDVGVRGLRWQVRLALLIFIFATGTDSLGATQTLSEDFSDLAFPPLGWESRNDSTPIAGLDWNRGPRSGLSTPTIEFASVNYESAESAGGSTAIADNWMLAPQMAFHNGDLVGFDTRSAYEPPIIPIDEPFFPDRMQVWLVRDANATSTTPGSRMLLDINPNYEPGNVYPYNWTSFQVALSGLEPAGYDGRLGFRYYVEDTGIEGSRGNEVWLDNVSVNSNALAPEPSAACVLVALGFHALFRRHRRY